MNKFFGLAAIALAFASCQSSGDRMEPVSTPATQTTFTPPATQATDSTQPLTVTPANTPASSAASSVALNPAHGQPGHRCDIPEGAPLNTPVGATATPAPANNQAPMMIQSQTPPPAANNNINQSINSNVRLNPAHGQPGHDCAIPVGQPLRN